MKNKKLLLFTLILTFSLTFVLSTPVMAAKKVKLSKTKLVLEMNTTEKLQLLNYTETAAEDTAQQTTEAQKASEGAGQQTTEAQKASESAEQQTTEAQNTTTAVKDTTAVETEAETTEAPVKGTVIQNGVKWTSSNEKVVTVGTDGTLTPVAVGSANITAKVKNKKYVCKVVVIDYTGMSIEQKEVVSYALQFVGNPYRYGGISLTKGADCSGFTYSVYKKFGYKLIHNAYSQMVDTKTVKMKKIKPGDLIFYGSSKSSCSHVALYIGNGKVVHASTETTGIVISDYKYRKHVGVGRVLATETYPDENGLVNPETDGVTPGEQVPDTVTSYAAPK